MSTTARGRYNKFYDGFAWGVPDAFNFAVDVVERWARDGDRPALIWENEAGEVAQYSFADIARLSDRLAHALRQDGVKKGDFVVVMLPRIPEWQIAIVAALKIGAVPIPCIEMLTERDIAYRVEHSGARAAICRAEQVGKFASLGARLKTRISVGHAAGWTSMEEVLRTEVAAVEPARVLAEDPAIMFYTSGSTGHPKGVLHAARALFAWRVSAEFWLALGPQDRIWCTADTGWSKAGTSILFGPWSRGACAFFYDGSFDPKRRLALLAKHRISVYCAPGTELYRVVNEDFGPHDLRALRRTVSAGEAMNPVIAERWRQATGITVSEAYGQTEALMLVLNYPSEPVKFGSMGLPSPGAKIGIIDDEGRELPDDTEGHIALRLPHPQMMLGYWREPERSASLTINAPNGTWYVTGDRAKRDRDGYIWYAGRSDDLINSAGYRIGPMEIENALLEHAAVQECAVIGVPDAERGEIVKAFVVLRADRVSAAGLVEALQNHVKSVTAPYKYPRAIEFVAELPKTMTGKIQRSALRQREKEKRA
jgi:acyl-coenzyme A synthetase/AMP-(fatty) acid ligase